jgi:hypothetical protein
VIAASPGGPDDRITREQAHADLEAGRNHGKIILLP